MEHSPNLPAGVHSSALRTIIETERRWASRRASDDEIANAFVWLRAARAAWAAGDPDEAAVWYRRASDGLLLCAQHTGHTSGTYAYYAEIAVGAALLSRSDATLDRVGNAVRRHVPVHPVVRRVGRNVDRPGDAAAAGRDVVCAWAAWACEAHQGAADLLRMANQEVNTLPSVAKQRWRQKRWAHLSAALTALLSLDYRSLGRSVHALDALTTATESAAAIASDFVDETVVVLAAHWRHADRESFQPEGLRTLIDPGVDAMQSAAAGQT